MLMPNRHSSTTAYRYAFNGMEKDDEVAGKGNSYTTEFRQYDTRIGRWKSLDPMASSFPHQSPYVAFDNNPIYFNDPKGLAADGSGDEKGKLAKAMGNGAASVMSSAIEGKQIGGEELVAAHELKSNTIVSSETSGIFSNASTDGSILTQMAKQGDELVELLKLSKTSLGRVFSGLSSVVDAGGAGGSLLSVFDKELNFNPAGYSSEVAATYISSQFEAELVAGGLNIEAASARSGWAGVLTSVFLVYMDYTIGQDERNDQANFYRIQADNSINNMAAYMSGRYTVPKTQMKPFLFLYTNVNLADKINEVYAIPTFHFFSDAAEAETVLGFKPRYVFIVRPETNYFKSSVSGGYIFAPTQTDYFKY